MMGSDGLLDNLWPKQIVEIVNSHPNESASQLAHRLATEAAQTALARPKKGRAKKSPEARRIKELEKELLRKDRAPARHRLRCGSESLTRRVTGRRSGFFRSSTLRSG